MNEMNTWWWPLLALGCLIAAPFVIVARAIKKRLGR